MNNYSVFTGETKMYKKFSLFSLLIISISMSLSAYEPLAPSLRTSPLEPIIAALSPIKEGAALE